MARNDIEQGRARSPNLAPVNIESNTQIKQRTSRRDGMAQFVRALINHFFKTDGRVSDSTAKNQDHTPTADPFYEEMIQPESVK